MKPSVMNPSVYIESTVISYYAARPSNNVIALAHQKITRNWWKNALPKLNPYISQFVIDEISKGNKEAAQARMALIKDIPILEATDSTVQLASIYFKAINIPEKARIDAFHLALATLQGMHYMVSWNCIHIASGRVRDIVDRINMDLDYATPVICTPDQLMEV